MCIFAEGETNPACDIDRMMDSPIVAVRVPPATANGQTQFRWLLDDMELPDLSRNVQLDGEVLHGIAHTVTAKDKNVVLCSVEVKVPIRLIDHVQFEDPYPKFTPQEEYRLKLRVEIARKARVVDNLASTLQREEEEVQTLHEKIHGQLENRRKESEYSDSITTQFQTVAIKLNEAVVRAKQVDSISSGICYEAVPQERCAALVKEREEIHDKFLELLKNTPSWVLSPELENTPQSSEVTLRHDGDGESVALLNDHPSYVEQLLMQRGGEQVSLLTDDMSISELKRRLVVLEAMETAAQPRLAEDSATKERLEAELGVLDALVAAAYHKANEGFRQMTMFVTQANPLGLTLTLNEQSLSRITRIADHSWELNPSFENIKASDIQIAAIISTADIHSPPPTTLVLAAMTKGQNLSIPPRIIRVFYATERERTPGPNIAFLDKRSTHDPLHFGIATVTIPPNHVIGEIEDPLWWKFERRPDRQKHFTMSLMPASEGDFYGSIRQQLKQYSSKNKEIFVFVHGFNNSFDDVLLRTAQIAADIGFEGAPIMYDWPSWASVWDYEGDKTSMLGSIPGLQAFLDGLAIRTGATTINVIAHSMGNYAVLSALDNMANQRKPIQVNQLILAAPDVDQFRMKTLISEVVTAKIARRITMYSSHSDIALLASVWKNKAQPAGGSSPVMVFDGVDTIDAAPIEGPILGHDYFATTRAVLTDIYALIKDSSSPPRMGLSEVGTGESHYWTFVPSRY